MVGPAEGEGVARGVVAAIVLAAGGGERFGGARALVRVDGDLLVDRAVAAARAAGCTPIVVVLGMAEADVRAQADLADVQVVRNPGWRGGSGSSLRLGLQALTEWAGPDGECAAAAVLVVETPGVTAAAVSRLVEQADAKSLRAATYGGRRGYPVLVGRDHWTGLAVLATGDVAERAYLTAHSDRLTTIACEDVADGSEYPPSAG
jgi:CTP:molybdopterin cytidylyltransferase MocA